MSIIQEALHRAEAGIKAPGARADDSQEKNIPAGAPSPRTAVSKIKKKIALNKTILLSLILVALIAFALFFAIHSLSPGKIIQDKVLAPDATQEVTYRPVIKADPKADDTTEPHDQAAPAVKPKNTAGYPDLILNGIMYIEEDPRAIINNSIVEAGDLVSGAKVMKINLKNVVLKYNDVEITLNLK